MIYAKRIKEPFLGGLEWNTVKPDQLTTVNLTIYNDFFA